MADRSVRVVLTAITAPYTAAMAKATASTKALAAQTAVMAKTNKHAQSAMSSMGLSSKLMIGGAIAGGFAYATKRAIEFESSFAGIRKTVDASEAEFQALEAGMRNLSTEIPVNVNELNRIGEAAGQLGIQTGNILSFTETMAKLGVTTNLSSEVAATSLARLANITQMPESQFDRLGSTIVALGNNLATTEAEITEFGLRIAGAGELAGMTEADVLAIGGAMSSVGVEAEAGGTAVQKVLLGISDSVHTADERLATFAQTAGMSAQEFQAAWQANPAQAFTAFVEGLGAAGKDANGVLKELNLTDQRLIRSFLTLAGSGDTLRQSIELGNGAWKENNALHEEAARRFSTTEARIDLAKNKIDDAAISIGDGFAPALGEAAETAGELVTTLMGVANWMEIFDRRPDEGGFFDAVGKFGGTVARNMAPGLHIFGMGVEKVSESSDEAADSVGGLAGEQEKAAEAAQEHTEALEDQISALDRLKGASGFLSIQGAAFGLQDAQQSLRDVRRELNKATKGTQEYREASRGLKRAQVDVLESQLSLVDAVQSYKEKIEAGEITQRDAVGLIRTYGREAGLSKNFVNGLIAEVKGLNSEYGKLPKAKSTRVTTPGLAASIQGINALENSLARIPRTLTTTHHLVTSGTVAAGTIKGRASGGSIDAYTPYVVGERGPELFVSERRGHIVPNHELRSSSPTTQETVIYVGAEKIVKATATTAAKTKVLLGGR